MVDSHEPVSIFPILLGESLSSHRRGRILTTAVNAQPSPDIPSEESLCLLFGSDFQSASEETQIRWFNWSQQPGRVLLLIPPFKSLSCNLPTEWNIQRRQVAPSIQEKGLVQALSSEVRFELEGQLQVPTQLTGQWDDQTLCTAFYRQHPHSGVFAITCLPLWSLVILDWVPDLKQWLSDLYGLAQRVEGAIAPSTEPNTFAPSLTHFTVLLHLLTDNFKSDSEALEALKTSTLLSLEPTQAAQCLQELNTHNLVNKATITAAGRQLLRQSQYAFYAEELEALAK